MTESSVRLGLDGPVRVLVFSVGALAGLGLGLAVPYLAGWAAALPWVPLSGPLKLVGFLDTPGAIWIRPAIGLLLGLAFATVVVHQLPILHVSAELIEVTSRGATRRIARSEVAGVYLDGRKVVIESHGGRRLFHGEVEGSKPVVRDAFVSRGYPWETV